MSPQFLSSFATLARQYDAFILDLWGVVHDGTRLYPGTIDCLNHLHAAGKRSLFLSNAPRRADTVGKVLSGMGLNPEAYDDIITSGETAYRVLASEDKNAFNAGGFGYVYIGLEKDRHILEGTPYKEALPEEANFLLIAHSFTDNQPMEELIPILKACATRKLPAICTNPDLEVVRLTGERIYCAGVVAREYEKLGGKVTYFGKPHPIVYEACFKVLADIPKARILAVGDTLHTDVAGGKKAGLATALVTGGVLHEKVGDPPSPDYQSKCRALMAQEKMTPDFVLPAFNW